MAELVNHLDFLVGSSQDVVADRHALDEWNSVSYIKYQQAVSQEQGSEIVNEHYTPYQWTSILDVYGDHHFSGYDSAVVASIISRVRNKHNGNILLNSLASILSSNRTDDGAAEDIAEAVGFDDIQLVMEIMQHRSALMQELDKQIHSDASTGLKNTKIDNDDLRLLSSKSARKRMEQTFKENAARPLFSGIAEEPLETLPHVYSSTSISQGNILSQYGSKFMLPLGTSRNTFEEYEEVIIPPSKDVLPRQNERLVPVAALDSLARGCFPGYVSLNRIQSIVYPTAYSSNENMLVCAPTGAGKTDVAMLTILRVIDQHCNRASPSSDIRSKIDRNSFKIIYVAPMKALAAEIVRKLGKRLKWLSITARELTGDMQLSKAEIAQTQIIVTTPEKWDVVTRKPSGEGDLASSLKLLIIDEVHLLNEERGAVIETIIARTLRQVESSQSVIRIVGLSATLPNYLDVADFLRVSRYKGLFFFDSSFRPVPLEQHFLGIKGKPGSALSKKNLDYATFHKVSEMVNQGHQVMVFVHARKETVKTAMTLREMAVAEGNIDEFSCQDHAQWSIFRRELGESKNKEMKLLFDNGFGIHHAGMLRSDRNMMEKMFEARAIKVLCCTATLAWGVNLPAHAVIIKGTQIYDSSKGSFVDLSVLDVLQVFGRAGRPGLETSGEGYICTTEDKLAHYLDAVTSQIPIESQFLKGMIDSLNAEISLGTVANIRDAVDWLGYTYLYVRMRKNPFIYGIPVDSLLEDPSLVSMRTKFITANARKLAQACMIVFDPTTESFTSTDLGTIAAKYYIRHSSMEIFNKNFRPKMSQADVLALLSNSTEFDQIQVRDSEQNELEQLMKSVPCEVKGGTENTYGKVNILLQAFISRISVDDFALISDMAYVAQNAGRIIRALLEIAISKKWAGVSLALMNMSKAVEKRLWPYEHPLKQFRLKPEVLYALERWADEWSVAELTTLDSKSLGELVHLNDTHGQAILNAAQQFPSVTFDYELRPIGSDILQISLRVVRAFMWSSKVHDSAEPFWLWVEDHHGVNILQLIHLMFRQNAEFLTANFIISVPGGQPPPFVTVRWVSDRWLGAEYEEIISLESIVMPTDVDCRTHTLDLPLLPVSSIVESSILSSTVKQNFAWFNSTQTHAFWTFVNSTHHALLCAPTGSGKTTLAQIAVWTALMKVKSRGGWAMLVATTKGYGENLPELRSASKALGIPLECITTQNALTKPARTILRIVTPAVLLRSLSYDTQWQAPSGGLDLVLCDNLELLDSITELAISLLRFQTQCQLTRFLGVSNSLNNASDLADWLTVDPSALFSFFPRDRDQALTFSTVTFTVPYSPALFKLMAKPAHAAIRTLVEGECSLIFIPSRAQCRPIALNLLTQCALDTESTKGYLPYHVDEAYLGRYVEKLQDQSLLDFISKGVGFFHSGIDKNDRNVMLELYAEGIIRVLIVPRDSCWNVPVRAAVVVVMGTQYVHFDEDNSDRSIRDFKITEIVRMQGRAVLHTGSGRFHLFCQSDSLDTITRFLNDGVPLESQLLETSVLVQWCRMQRNQGFSITKQDIVDILSFTFLARRVASNPSYYRFTPTMKHETLSNIADVIFDKI
ncbi:Sec63 Brl domain-containing protein [Cyathus striatus]|nr:Sec63 Brl domain-containing protein [Cyathus striatus]